MVFLKRQTRLCTGRAKTSLIFLILLVFFLVNGARLLAQNDPRERSHSVVLLPFSKGDRQFYYLTWASSFGSVDGAWQHDIYRETVAFTAAGSLQIASAPVRFIGNGRDEAQEPVSAALNPKTNAIFSVWEDGSGSTVDVRGQLHFPDGNVIRHNWILAGGPASQHSPKVAHVGRFFLVAYTDEAPPAEYALIRAQLRSDADGQLLDSKALTPASGDNWWPIVAATDGRRAFVGWGDGENLGGRVVSVSGDSFSVSPSRNYLTEIKQYNYSVIWLKAIARFFLVARSGNDSKICLVDSLGNKTLETKMADAPLTRETQLAFRQIPDSRAYTVAFPTGKHGLLFLLVRQNAVRKQHSVDLQNTGAFGTLTWPTTGIACSFVRSKTGEDLWRSQNLLFCAFNNAQTNHLILLPLFFRDFSGVAFLNSPRQPQAFRLQPIFPNPFSQTATLNFSLRHSKPVAIHIFNIRGQAVLSQVLGTLPSGRHRFVWNGKNTQGGTVGSGVYFVRIKSGGFSLTQKVLFLNK